MRSILVKVMGLPNDASLSQQSGANAIYGIIEPSFEFAMMATHSLGPTSGSLSGGQRQGCTRTFSHLFRDSYTRLVLNCLKKGNIQYGQESREGDKSKVAATSVRPHENLPVTYFMHPTPQGWIPYAVISGGLSGPSLSSFSWTKWQNRARLFNSSRRDKGLASL